LKRACSRAIPHKAIAKSTASREGTLSLGERELIATHVSILNNCAYCQAAHGSIACAHLQDPKLVSAIKADPETSELISPKIKALLRIAGMVTKSGKEVSEEAVESARKEGATEMDVHDTVLIAAMFCMFNRYVDGLGTEMPGNLRVFEGRGKVIAERGYGIPVPVESRKDGEPS
jgi:uncharacterized peroxidase-related enzyme